MKLNLEVVRRLSAAIIRLATSASEYLGSDCALHAAMAHELLQREGIDTRIVYGEAAWRVGPGDSDTIAHSPAWAGVAPAGVPALAYHAWLETEDRILDFTTYTLRLKAAKLDKLDGGKTDVLWCPDYLWLSRSEAKTVKQVIQAPKEGVAGYREIVSIGEILKSNGFIKALDPTISFSLRVLYERPDVLVVGHNDFAAAHSGAA